MTKKSNFFKTSLIIIICSLICLSSNKAAADDTFSDASTETYDWKKKYDTWRCYKDGKPVENERKWVEKDEGTAFIDKNGCALNGWQYIKEFDGYYYFEESTGLTLTGKQMIDGYPYTFDSTGRLVSEPLWLWGGQHRDVTDNIKTGWYTIRYNGEDLLNTDKFYIERVGYTQYTIYAKDGALSSNMRIEPFIDTDSFIWYFTKSGGRYSIVSKENGYVITNGTTLSPVPNDTELQSMEITGENGIAFDTSGYTHNAARRNTVGERNGANPYNLVKTGEMYQLVNKLTGEVVQEGPDIFIGTFFSTNAYACQHRLITLNGKDFVDIPDTFPAAIRDSSIISEDGKFYYVHYGGQNTGRYYQTVTTDFNSYSKTNTSFKNFTDFVDESYGYQIIWAPEWFKDNSREYVFFSTTTGNVTAYNETLGRNHTGRFFRIGYTKVHNKNTYSDAKEAIFNYIPDPGVSLIDAQIIKVDGKYIMTVKQDGAVKSSRHDKILIYTSRDIEGSWEYLTTVEAFPSWETDGSAYEAPCLAYINGKYFLYADHYIDKVTGQRTADGEVYYATSHNLTDWVFEGVVSAENESLRHGSVTAVTDTEAVNVIMDLFNGSSRVSDIPKNIIHSIYETLQALADFWDLLLRKW